MIKAKKDRSFIEKIQDSYTAIDENKKTLRKIYLAIIIIITLYYFIDAYTNYDFSYFLLKEIYLGIYVACLSVIKKLFHELFGKWFIHENKRRLTVRYIKEKMPRAQKYEGPTGIGKDSTVNGVRKIFREDIIDYINDKMDVCEVICYPYDFNKIKEYLDKHKNIFMTNSKNEYFTAFLSMLKTNNCFIKKQYEKDFDTDKHLKEYFAMQKNPYDPIHKKNPYKFDDGIKVQHYLSLVLKYCIHYIRINYLDNFVITNQPTMEIGDKPAKLFSTRFTNIQTKNSEWPWPIDGNVIIIETESDAFYPNVGLPKGENPMKTGYRNTKAFWRQFFKEKSVWINIGQKSSRTHKTMRELDHVFITIIEQSIVFGGEKRIFFLDKYLSWINFWLSKSIFKKSKEKQLKRRSKILERIKYLDNTGYIYVDLKVSRSDQSFSAEEMSLKTILSYDKKIYENYTVKLCFTIKDLYEGYNTEYMEAIAELKAKASKLKWGEVMTWDPDLIMKKKHMEYIGYRILDDIAGIDRKKLEKKNQQKNKESEEDHDEEIQEEE